MFNPHIICISSSARIIIKSSKHPSSIIWWWIITILIPTCIIKTVFKKSTNLNFHFLKKIFTSLVCNNNSIITNQLSFITGFFNCSISFIAELSMTLKEFNIPVWTRTMRTCRFTKILPTNIINSETSITNSKSFELSSN